MIVAIHGISAGNNIRSWQTRLDHVLERYSTAQRNLEHLSLLMGVRDTYTRMLLPLGIHWRG
jgi:hypothetical protein